MKGVAKKYSFTLFGVSLPDAFIRPHQGLKCLFRFGPRKSLAEGWMDEVWRIWSKFNHFQNVNKILENWHYLRTFKSRLLSWPSSVNEFFIGSLIITIWAKNKTILTIYFKGKSWHRSLENFNIHWGSLKNLNGVSWACSWDLFV